MALFFYRTHVSCPDHIVYTVNITFLEVKMEDYGHPFMCHAGASAAYFMLKLPGNVPMGYILFRVFKLMAKKHIGKRSDVKCLV